MLHPDGARWIAAALSQIPFREATITHEVMLATNQVSLPQRDPADRFLAASAKAYDLTIVTADERLIGGSGYKVLANK